MDKPTMAQMLMQQVPGMGSTQNALPPDLGVDPKVAHTQFADQMSERSLRELGVSGALSTGAGAMAPMMPGLGVPLGLGAAGFSIQSLRHMLASREAEERARQASYQGN